MALYSLTRKGNAWDRLLADLRQLGQPKGWVGAATDKPLFALVMSRALGGVLLLSLHHKPVG